MKGNRGLGVSFHPVGLKPGQNDENGVFAFFFDRSVLQPPTLVRQLWQPAKEDAWLESRFCTLHPSQQGRVAVRLAHFLCQFLRSKHVQSDAMEYCLCDGC